MVVFPPAKINLGLRILRRRADGYHDLESVFYPIPWTDVLEILPAPEDHPATFHMTGVPLPEPSGPNLVEQACALLTRDFQIPPLQIHLHKCLPSGAGLGGGSSDASGTLCLLNKMFDLGLSEKDLMKYAAKLGSDCPFFIRNRPSLVTGRGEILEDFPIDLDGWYLAVVCPPVHISTQEAYTAITPRETGQPVTEALKKPVTEWRESLVNDFETALFPRFPLLAEVKEELYRNGAVYASMTGSGSALYGLFRKKPAWQHTPKGYGMRIMKTS